MYRLYSTSMLGILRVIVMLVQHENPGLRKLCFINRHCAHLIVEMEARNQIMVKFNPLKSTISRAASCELAVRNSRKA